MHKPVMVKEVLEGLLTEKSEIIFDATAGMGGHSEAIVADSGFKGKLICSDRDEDALRISEERLSRYGDRIRLVRLRFSQIGDFLSQEKIKQVSGFLFDIGLCTLHLEDSRRGFSFQSDGPLDMRMDRSQSKSALQVVNDYSQAEIADLLWKFGQERLSKAIARAIVKSRQRKTIQTTMQLKNVIESVLNPKYRIKSLARVFQAIRIEVNDELNELKQGLKLAVDYLESGGRLALISYHSLEHRIIRQNLREESKGCICPPHLPVCTCNAQTRLRMVSPKPILPSLDEKIANPKSRSAMLWVAERLRTE
jgi:16S rRNA (cytosine1402-N4)-methyltransferase